MAPQLPSGTQEFPGETNTNRNRLAVGVMLVAIGLLALALQFIDLGNLVWLVFGGLAVIFIATGIITRTFELVIPGGILAGLGLGMFMMLQPVPFFDGVNEGGVFLLGFAAGWLLIALLSPLTGEGFQWWPLIPGGIIGAVGLALMSGQFGLTILQFAGLIWPVALIVGGIYLLLRRK
jgi:hypothetical protein